MWLETVATGSAANCYVLTGNEGDSLILDAGVPVRKVLHAIKDFRRVAGCLITHEHQDHARAWQDFCMRGIPVLMSEGTRNVLNSKKAVVDYFAPMIVKPMQRVILGRFVVMPFETQHDAAEPLGYLIQYKPTGEKIIYATDTYYLRYTFPGINYWIVECNYCEDLIDGETDIALRNRLKESHMSQRRLMDALRANDLTEAAHIVLVHLSDSRSNEQRMVTEIGNELEIETHAAKAGQRLHLMTTPF